MKKFKSIIIAGVVLASISVGLTVSATTAHPAPLPIIDEWNYGVNDNYGYSNYYVKSPNNIGSKSSVKNFWGSVKDSDEQKFGWALSSATKSWNDVRLAAFWNYYYF